ncbi:MULTISPECIES: DUF2922 domain-containing protein [Enterococcus]|uniref:DUF2922 domain-containing protein n=1 Tax=Enterococcus alishanensis TaxID=1303817 RepID=A0ABS6TDZ0_9ENTE|nr:DUF2922 domain-containing protein [Enterococcus alishanensis]MBV7391120.1 DUF2922 domain-containing protein [Enterococcus alishanensis]
MLKLSAVFKNSVGKNHTWSYNEPNKDLTADEIKNELVKLSTLGIFEKDDVRLFSEVVEASFVETIETPIF